MQVLRMHFRRVVVFILVSFRRNMAAPPSPSSSSSSDSDTDTDFADNPTRSDSRETVLEAAFHDFCPFHERELANERCKNGFRQLKRLPKEERGETCTNFEDAACRWVKERQRDECTARPAKSKACFGFCSWRWKRRNRGGPKFIPILQCADNLLKRVVRLVKKRNSLRKGLVSSGSDDEYTGYEGILNSPALSTLLASSKIREVMTHEEFKTVSDATTKMVVLIIYARLCRRWRYLQNALIDLVDEYQGVLFLKVDIDKKLEAPGAVNEETAHLPTFMLQTPYGEVIYFHTTSVRKIRKVLEDNKAISSNRRANRQYSVARSLEGDDFFWLRKTPSLNLSPSGRDRRDSPSPTAYQNQPLRTTLKESPKTKKQNYSQLSRDISIHK